MLFYRLYCGQNEWPRYPDRGQWQYWHDQCSAYHGAKGGALTFGGDLLKAFIPTLVVRFVMCPRMDMDLEYTYLFTLIVGLGVVIGHNFPFELHFKGGKGIAVSAAVIVASSAGTRLGWWMIAGGIVLFVAVVALTR